MAILCLTSSKVATGQHTVNHKSTYSSLSACNFNIKFESRCHLCKFAYSNKTCFCKCEQLA